MQGLALGQVGGLQYLPAGPGALQKLPHLVRMGSISIDQQNGQFHTVVRLRLHQRPQYRHAVCTFEGIMRGASDLPTLAHCSFPSAAALRRTACPSPTPTAHSAES